MDLDQDDDGILNRGDNCPLVIDYMGFDADIDGIGDACDPNPYQPDGQAEEVTLTQRVHIGAQETAAIPPAAGGEGISDQAAQAGSRPGHCTSSRSAPHSCWAAGIAVAGIARSRRGE